ncbi:MAG: DUF4350 domain-containing protein [Myxococcales bacterium]|nr:DUF4350 domain-containing protein [Myxococcales bacterium]
MNPPDRTRLIWALGLFAALAFAAGVLLAILDPAETGVRSHAADTFSRSAVGHRGLVRWLRALGVPVVVSRGDTAAKAAPGTVLAILEPPLDVDPDRLRDLVDRSEASALLIALPKWTVEPHARERGFVAEVAPVAAEDRDKLLDALYITARSAPAEAGDYLLDDAPAAVTLKDPVGVRGEIVPRLSRGETVLVGQARLYGRPLLLVADPDLIANAGLVAHAPLLAALLGELIGDRVLVVDETLHGHRTAGSLARQLFEFPLAAITLQLLAVVLLALLAGVRRFGAPVPLPQGFGRGRRVLIENTAALGHHAGHDGDALRRYFETTLRRVQRALHAPAELRGEAALQWLARVGRARRVDEDPAALAAAAESARPQDRLAVARRIDAWRRALLDTHDPGRPR